MRESESEVRRYRGVFKDSDAASWLGKYCFLREFFSGVLVCFNVILNLSLNLKSNIFLIPSRGNFVILDFEVFYQNVL